jgi:hypothetical protein
MGNDGVAPLTRWKTSRDCISYLSELCDNIKQSPGRLIDLLIQLLKAHNLHGLSDANLALGLHHLMAIVNERCIGDSAKSHIASSHELARSLTRSRDMVLREWEYLSGNESDIMARLGRKDEFSARCTKAIHGLLTPTLITFGAHSGRSIACARPLLVSDAARGWSGMYDGERTKLPVSILTDRGSRKKHVRFLDVLVTEEI